MKLTKHAKTRIRQRGLPETLPEVFQAWGCLEQAPGGTERIFLGKKEANRLRNEVTYEYRRVLELIDRCTNGTLIVGGDDTVITAYRRG